MFPYAKLLLKLRLKSWNPVTYFSLDRSKRKSVATTIGVLLGVAVLAFYLILFEMMMFDAFVQMNEPTTMLAVVVALGTLMMLVTSFFYVLTELFFAKDVLFVSSLPIPSRQLLWAKMMRIWLGEALIALVICMPAVILYGIHTGAGILYYLMGTLLSLFMPLFPIAVITLLSFAIIRISGLWKHREKLTIVVSVLFMTGIIWFQMQWTTNMGNDTSLNGAVYQLVQSQQSTLNLFTRLYPPAGWFATALSAQGMEAILPWLGFAAINLGAAVLVAVALGGRYQQLAIRQNETRVRMNTSTKRRAETLKERTPLMALYRREIREIFSSPSYALNCLAAAIVFPVLFVVAFVGKSSSFSALGELMPMLDTLPTAIILAAFTALFTFAGAMNMAVGTAVSREGIRHEFYRTLPVPPSQLLLSKLMMGLTVGMINSLPSMILISVLFPSLLQYAVIGWLLSLLFISFTAIISLMMDVGHPKFSWKNETEAIKQNGMASLSMFAGMGVVAASGFLSYWIEKLGVSTAMIFGALCVLAAAADLLLLRRLVTKSAMNYIQKEVNL